MHEYVEKYANQGFKIFPCNLDKTPATANGFYAATNDNNILSRQFYKPEILIGLPTGNVNGIVVIDFDVNKEIVGTRKKDVNGKPIIGSGDIDHRSVDDLIEEIKALSPTKDFDVNTFTVETPSGGRHLYFKTQNTKLSSHARFFNKTLPVDIRANGGYVVAPDGSRYIVYDDVDNLEIDNILARCLFLPEWIETYIKVTNYNVETLPGSTVELLPATEVRELRSALSYIDADDRDTWIQVGLALKSTMTGDQAKGIWTEWSMKSDKFDATAQEKTWKGLKPHDISIASIFHLAKQKGWTTTYTDADNIPSGTSERPIIVKSGTAAIVVKSAKFLSKPIFPKTLLRPPGLLGEITDYMNTNAIKDQPILHVGAAFALAGAMMGRRYETDTEIRTNVYIIGLGDSGCGKETARSCIKKILQASNKKGLAEICATEEIASDTAIYNTLNENPAQIFLLDEIGKLLQMTRSAAKSPHLFGIPSVLLKLYASSNAKMSAKSYADTKKNVVLNNPHLCIYGSATQDQFYNSLTVDNISDGLISRMLIFESEERDPMEKFGLKKTRPPMDLLNKIEYLYGQPTNHYLEGNVDGTEAVRPLIVDYSNDAEMLARKYSIDMHERRSKLGEDDKAGAVFNRAALTVRKLALICAISEDVYNTHPMIKVDHIDYAVQLTNYLMDNMYYAVEKNLAESEYEQSLKKVYNLIALKGSLSMSQITRKTQNLTSKIRNDILHALVESEKIQEVFEISATKSKKVYRIFQEEV